MSEFAVKWQCPRGHFGVDAVATDLDAHLRIAAIRGSACELCGAQVAVSHVPGAPVPEAVDTRPEPLVAPVKVDARGSRG